MKLMNIERVALSVTNIELYALGWDGNPKFVGNRYESELLKRAGYKYTFYKLNEIIKQCEGFFFIVELYSEVKLIEIPEVNDLRYIKCPDCYGSGEIEYSTSHSWYENCKRCNGKGTIMLEDYYENIKTGKHLSE